MEGPDVSCWRGFGTAALPTPSKRLQAIGNPPSYVVHCSGLDERPDEFRMLCGIAGAKFAIDHVYRFCEVERYCFWSLVNRVVGIYATRNAYHRFLPIRMCVVTACNGARPGEGQTSALPPQ